MFRFRFGKRRSPRADTSCVSRDCCTGESDFSMMWRSTTCLGAVLADNVCGLAMTVKADHMQPGLGVSLFCRGLREIPDHDESRRLFIQNRRDFV